MTDLNELLKHTSRSLYLSARLLPSDVRAAFSIAYLLCRYADSIADTALLSPQKRLSRIEQFPSMITHPDQREQQLLTEEISGTSSNIYEEKLLHNLPACLQFFYLLPECQQKIILEVVHAVCEGMKTDLQVFPPENEGIVSSFRCAEDLEHYCRLMGGAPGVFWSKLITSSVQVKPSEETFWKLGQDIGDALQIVNILRDLPKDLRIGRCYFPSEELAANGLKPRDLLDKSNNEKFEPVKQKWIAWGRAKLRSAYTYYQALPKTQLRHRAAVAWPVLWAADTLNKLSAVPNLLDEKHRVKIPRSRIYGTMALTPAIWASDALFVQWLSHKLQNENCLSVKPSNAQ